MTLDRLKSTWENLGRVDPLWAVLTDPDRRHGGWDVAEFLDTGARPVQDVLAMLAEAQLSFGDRVLDFGCGAGRLSNALAEHVREVVGVDIAASMIDQAHRINRHPERVRFVHYDGARLPFPDESFDGVLSLISIQHSPPAVQVASLVELQRVVRPGGVLAVQIPSRPSRPVNLPTEAMRARIELIDPPARLGVGQPGGVRAAVTNVSEHVWPAGRLIRLGNHWYAGAEPARWNDGRVDLPHDVAPGTTVTLDLPVVAPQEAGEYVLELDVVQEAVSWWAEVGSETVRTVVTVAVDAVAGVDVPVPQEPEIHPAPAARGRDDGGMEMFGMDPNLVRLLLAHCGSELVNLVPDTMAGAEWESFTYLVRRGESA